MKIGIITFTHGQNFGNKLQNYALLNVLSTLYGNEVYTLKTFDRTTNGNTFDHIKKNTKLLFNLHHERAKRKKQKLFDSFSENYLNYYSIPLKSNKTDELSDFDAFVCGSDQIWNPYYNKDLELFTAYFAKSGKRVSYAASIGLSKIPAEKNELYKKCIGSMDYIGVREEQAAHIIKELTGKNAVVQIDPTMLVEKEVWSEFAKKPNKNIPKHYILTYFICEMNDIAKNEVKKLADDTGLPVISLNDIANEDWYALNPNEFVWMIKNADYILADSFHATVFSVIFHIPIHCFNRMSREKQNEQASRLQTLLNYFGLEKCISNEAVQWDIDFSNVDDTIERLRESSVSSLIDSLSDNIREERNFGE